MPCAANALLNDKGIPVVRETDIHGAITALMVEAAANDGTRGFFADWTMSAIPNMRVYLPSDRHRTKKLVEALLRDEQGAYIRVGRNPVEDIYTGENCPLEMNKATVLAEGTDVLLVACGEMVRPAKEAAELLKKDGVSAAVLDMYCVKPLDKETLLRYTEKVKAVVTVEEHAPSGGLGSMVAQAVAGCCPRKVKCLALPDAPVIAGTSQEVFDHYGLNAEGIAKAAKELLA